jgi:CMP/dCMP kinase
MSNRPAGMVVVALDGPAGAGKSTAARMLADRLGYVLVDTGALYRGVALAARERALSWDDGPALGALVDGLELGFLRDLTGGKSRLTIDGIDRSGEIRTPDMSDGASRVSRHREVRGALLGLQRRLGERGGVVLEGRDIGTVVFPDAEVKVFLTASDEARAQRRHDELVLAGHNSSFDEVLGEIRERDRRDRERDVAPLRAAADAVLLDTSGSSLDQVVNQLEGIVRARIAASS